MSAAKSPKDDSGAEKTAEAARLQALAQDWITLWQSELTAMAADRELREGWTQLMALWAGAASHAVDAGMAMARHQPHHDEASRRTSFQRGWSPPGPARSAAGHAAAGAAPGAAASDAGSDAVERLHRRIAALEARLLAVERGAGPG